MTAERPLRVLTVGNMYPPHHFGGYEQVWRAAVEHLRAQGHDVRVLTTDARTGSTEPDDPDVHRALHWTLRDGEFQTLGLRGRAGLARHNHRVLRHHLADLRPDVVTWWSMGGLTLSLLEEVRRRGVPAVAFVHDEWLVYGSKVDPWLQLVSGGRRLAAPLAELVTGVPGRVRFADAATYVFVSAYVREHAARRGLRLERTAVAPSGIDPVFLDPAPERPWSGRLLYVGRIDGRKGIDTAVEALAHLPEECTLDVVGGGDDREEERLRRLADDLGVAARVRFAGHQGREGLFDAYADADAVLFPVVWQEPWGLVPLEAMARGRPVVASGRGGSAEYLRDGENCLLAEAEDAAALAGAVRRLGQDAGLRARLRAGGLATAPRYTEATFNAAVEAAVREAAASSSSSR